MKKANILIVEDESIVAQEIKICLENMGHAVASMAKRGEEAIIKAEEDLPDIILMDIQLKGQMDGIEAADIIQSRLGIPVIFLTAYHDDERLERAKFTRPYGYVLKPFQERDLKITIEMALYAAEMEAWRKRAEEKLREQKKFQGVLEMAGAVCHELNQPLQSVSGFSELLFMDMETSDPNYESVEKIKLGIERIGELTRKIMKITRYRSKSYLNKNKIIDIERASRNEEGGEL